MKLKTAGLLTLVAAFLVGTSGCVMQVHSVAPTPQVIKQIGLPVYPKSTPRFAMDSTESAGVRVRQLSVTFETRDDLDTVQRFYSDHVPRSARRIVIPLSIAKSVAYQWYDKASQKQVMIMRLKDSTMIQLRSMQFGSATPQPSQ